MTVTTTTDSLHIVCPPWCTIPAQEHADQLWDDGGECFPTAAKQPSSTPPTAPPNGCHAPRCKHSTGVYVLDVEEPRVVELPLDGRPEL